MPRVFNAKELAALKDAFDSFDLQDKGLITLQNLGEVMNQLGFSMENREVHRMIKLADKDGNGAIDFEEFKTLMSRYDAEQDRRKISVQIFQMFDQNADGVISSNEILQAMKHHGMELKEKEIKEMIRTLDKNHDEKIDYYEFANLWNCKWCDEWQM